MKAQKRRETQEFESHDICEVFFRPRNSSPTIFARFSTPRNSSPTIFARFSTAVLEACAGPIQYTTFVLQRWIWRGGLSQKPAPALFSTTLVLQRRILKPKRAHRPCTVLLVYYKGRFRSQKKTQKNTRVQYYFCTTEEDF